MVEAGAFLEVSEWILRRDKRNKSSIVTFNSADMFLKVCTQGLLIALVLGQLMFSAASTLPKLTCNISRLPDGSFWYALSKPPPNWLWSNGCEITWDDANKIAIVLKRSSGIEKNDTLVLNVTDMGIVMNECRKMHYKVNCPTGRLDFVEAFCEVNCSLISVVDPPPPNGPIMGNNTNCIFPGFCLSNLQLVLLVLGIGVPAILVAVCFAYRRVFHRCLQRFAPVCGARVETTNVNKINKDDQNPERAIMMNEVENRC